MILSNQIMCVSCGDRPYSRHVHDLRQCECGAVAVDGGMEYLRRVGNWDYHDISVVINDEHGRLLLEAIEDRTRNPLGKLCSVARVLRDSMGINIGDTNG